MSNSNCQYKANADISQGKNGKMFMPRNRKSVVKLNSNLEQIMSENQLTDDRQEESQYWATVSQFLGQQSNAMESKYSERKKNILKMHVANSKQKQARHLSNIEDSE